MATATDPQPNPPLHPVDWVTLVLSTIGGAAVFADMLPAKVAGVILILNSLARHYTKWLGTKLQVQALDAGVELGQELKGDLGVLNAKRAEKV